MKTVKEMSEFSGVSARTLRYYDQIGLLKPDKTSEAGYRYYEDSQTERLQWIVLYRELGFSLKQIAELLEADDDTRNVILRKQIADMEEKRKKLDNRLLIARGIELIGVKTMSFDGFERDKIDDYVTQAKLHRYIRVQ